MDFSGTVAVCYAGIGVFCILRKIGSSQWCLKLRLSKKLWRVVNIFLLTMQWFTIWLVSWIEWLVYWAVVTLVVVRVFSCWEGLRGLPRLPSNTPLGKNIRSIVRENISLCYRRSIAKDTMLNGLWPHGKVDMKLRRRRNYHRGQAAIRHYAYQTARPLWPLGCGPNFTLGSTPI